MLLQSAWGRHPGEETFAPGKKLTRQPQPMPLLRLPKQLAGGCKELAGLLLHSSRTLRGVAGDSKELLHLLADLLQSSRTLRGGTKIEILQSRRQLLCGIATAG